MPPIYVPHPEIITGVFFCHVSSLHNEGFTHWRKALRFTCDVFYVKSMTSCPLSALGGVSCCGQAAKFLTETFRQKFMLLCYSYIPDTRYQVYQRTFCWYEISITYSYTRRCISNISFDSYE